MKRQQKQRLDYKTGRLLCDIRKAQGISGTQLSYGLYSSSTYCKIERGDQEPDKFILDVLFERMGMSVEQYGTVYTLNEYLIFEQRNIIIEALWEGEWEAAEEFLKEYEGWIAEMGQEAGKEELQQQFIRYAHIALQMEQGIGGNQKEEILAAIRLTIPEFRISNISHYLYGELEQALLILLVENEYRYGDKEKSITLYMENLQLIENSRLYPEALLSLAEKLAEQERYSELTICEQGLAALWERHRMNGLAGLLRLELLGWEHGNPVPEGESPDIYRQAIRLLENMREMSGEHKRAYSYPLLKTVCRGELLGERILRLRKSLNMTLEQLCEGICEPENLSRIERGEAKPTANRYRKLMKRLGVEECRFYPRIRTDQYALYQELEKLETLVSRWQYNEAEECLEKLELGLDEREVVNRQILLENRTMIDAALNRISREQEREQLWNALWLTVPEGVDISLWPLNQTEVRILNDISVSMDRQGKEEKAAELLWKVRKRYEFTMSGMVRFRKKQGSGTAQELLWRYRKEGMGLEYNAATYLLITENLLNCIGSEGEYEKAMEMAEEALRLAYKVRKSYTVSNLLYEIAWDTEQIMEREQKDIAAIREVCFPLFYQSFLMATVSKQKRKKNFIMERCRKKYGRHWEDYLSRWDVSSSF